MWQCKNGVIVGNRENIFKSGFNPPALVYALAFGAMSVTAGIIVIFDITAGIALIDVIAIMGGSAAFNGIHHFVLFFCDAVLRAIFFSITPEDIGDFVIAVLSISRSCFHICLACELNGIYLYDIITYPDFILLEHIY